MEEDPGFGDEMQYRSRVEQLTVQAFILQSANRCLRCDITRSKSLLRHLSTLDHIYRGRGYCLCGTTSAVGRSSTETLQQTDLDPNPDLGPSHLTSTISGKSTPEPGGLTTGNGEDPLSLTQQSPSSPSWSSSSPIFEVSASPSKSPSSDHSTGLAANVFDSPICNPGEDPIPPPYNPETGVIPPSPKRQCLTLGGPPLGCSPPWIHSGIVGCADIQFGCSGPMTTTVAADSPSKPKMRATRRRRPLRRQLEGPIERDGPEPNPVRGRPLPNQQVISCPLGFITQSLSPRHGVGPIWVPPVEEPWEVKMQRLAEEKWRALLESSGRVPNRGVGESGPEIPLQNMSNLIPVNSQPQLRHRDEHQRSSLQSAQRSENTPLNLHGHPLGVTRGINTQPSHIPPQASLGFCDGRLSPGTRSSILNSGLSPLSLDVRDTCHVSGQAASNTALVRTRVEPTRADTTPSSSTSVDFTAGRRIAEPPPRTPPLVEMLDVMSCLPVSPQAPSPSGWPDLCWIYGPTECGTELLDEIVRDLEKEDK